VLGNFFVRRIKADLDFSPPITFLIAAHNEESLIKGAVQSILELNYPKNQIKIIIGSDGSTDNTNAILEQMQVELGKNFNYFIYPRSGKNKVLNDLINKVETDFILFMDADCRVSSSTAIEIMKNYSDERVGCVIASQSVISENNDENTGRLGDTLYHKYEQIIRINESKIHSNVNSLGYLYSVRKNLLKPIPDDFVCDDLYNVYSVLENGFRVVFEKNAHAREIRQKSLNNELHRRVRAVAGGIATVFAYYRLMNVIKYGWVSFFLISHKVFRWLSP